MKWSWFDIAFELSTAANSRFCTTTNAKRSCQKVWSFHPNRWIQGEKRSVGGHHGRRWIWGWCDVNLDPTGPLDPWFLWILSGNITISTKGTWIHWTLRLHECQQGFIVLGDLRGIGGFFRPVIGLANDYIQGAETWEIFRPPWSFSPRYPPRA